MTPTKAFLSVLTAAALFAGAAPALAQEWTFNPNAPLDIHAPEQGAYSMQTCSYDLSGNVQVTQDRVRLLARTMKAFETRRDGKCGTVNRIEADRDVYFVTPNEKVRADHAVYDLLTDTVTFTGGVIVVRGENVSSSERLVINIRTNDFTSSGGVRAVLYPDRTGQ